MAVDESYYESARQGVRSLLPSACRRVLEVGCGTGRFADALPSSVEEAWGVEPHAVAAREAMGRFDRVLRGTYREVEGHLPDAHFDLVVCNDVIEHMPDADAFCRDIQRKMTPGARLVGSVPNVRYYRNLVHLVVGKDWRYTDAGILDRTHQRFFTLKSIRRALGEAGLEVEIVRGLGGEFRAGARNLGTRLLRGALLGGLLLATLGMHSDIQYQQCGFRARVAGAGQR